MKTNLNMSRRRLTGRICSLLATLGMAQRSLSILSYLFWLTCKEGTGRESLGKRRFDSGVVATLVFLCNFYLDYLTRYTIKNAIMVEANDEFLSQLGFEQSQNLRALLSHVRMERP